MAQSLQKSETISSNLTKCGEISASMFENRNEFYLNCEFCDCSYLQMNNFIQHIYDDHLVQLSGRQFKQEAASTPLYSQESLDCYDLVNATEEHLEDDVEFTGAQEESRDASNNFETVLLDQNEFEIKEEVHESIKNEEDVDLQTPNDAEFFDGDGDDNMVDNMENSSCSKESQFNDEQTFILELIKLYQTLPDLWNVKSKHYRDPVIRTEQYNTLLNKFRERYPEAELEDVKRKLHVLRSNYTREKRLLQTKKSESKLYFYNEFRFLDQNKCDSKSGADKSEHCETDKAETYNDIDVTPDEEMLSILERNPKRKKKSWAKNTQKFNHVEGDDVNETSKEVATFDQSQDDPKPTSRYIKATDSIIDISQRIILAEIYKKHTCLWDDTDIEYRLTNRRNDALKSVHEEFNNKSELNLTENAFSKEVLCLRKICSNEKRKKITCKQKNIEYKTSCTYWNHIEYLEVDVAPYVCSTCGKQYRGPTQLKVHEATHDGSEPFKCNFCGRGFQLVHYLTQHLRRHVKDRQYHCEVCNKEFVTSSEVVLHMRKHTGERPFVCYICGSTYISSSALLEHIMRHKQDKRFKCDICSKAYYSSSRLRSHKNTHSNVCKYICEICQKGFKERKLLSQHALIHNSVKRYICKICGKRFAQYAGLSCHMKSHGTTLALNTMADIKLK